MSRQNVMVFQNMRPPVAADYGQTPLRGKKVENIFTLANGDYEDKSGYKITKDQVVQNYTDDARLQDSSWNMRHHVTPSNFNKKNSKYYKNYFDKDFRNKQGIMNQPQRQLDPYDENEVKGTRMPDYTKLAQERDIYGELGWINNWNVKCSKNNTKLYPTYREYFDGPRNYHTTFNNSTMTNNEFFRQNAPKSSVARMSRPKRDMDFSPHSSTGMKTFTSKRRGGSMVEQSKMGGSHYDTPFLLEKEAGNKFRVVNDVERTMDKQSEIPFLRTQINPLDYNKAFNTAAFTGMNFGRSSYTSGKQRAKTRDLKKRARKESNWNGYVKPISKFNSQVHPSMRIPFEQI